MLSIENESGLNLDPGVLEKIIDTVVEMERDIDLLICDNEKIRELNAKYRGKDSITDVLSFPLDEADLLPGMPLGSIVISAEMAAEKADELGHRVEEELSLLFIHGLLHLMGYDHETDGGEMREIERDIVRKLSLPESLIVRNE